MAKHVFLSDPWLDEARTIYDEYKGKAPAPQQAVKINLVISDVPFEKGTIDAHIDTSSGELAVDIGHIEGADVKVTLDYDTAKAVLVDGNFQAAIQAFMAGKIKAEGDITKLMALQTSGVLAADPVTAEIGKRIQDITE